MTKITDKERAAILLEDGEVIEQRYEGNDSIYIVKAFGQRWRTTKNIKRWHVEQIRGVEQ